MAKPLQSGDPPQIGDWKLLGRLGEGGMGVVYLGQRTVNGIASKAAIKVIRDAGQSGGEWERSVLRFKREIDALLRLDVAGAVSIIAADLASRPMWYASDYVDGAQDLHEYVRSHGPLDPADAERLAHELTATLTEVHDRGIVHRDIKPNNILICKSGRSLLIDFGIATVAGGLSYSSTGQHPGTAIWSSPAQLRGEAVGSDSDRYSLGMVLVYAATGRHPFDSSGEWNEHAIRHAIESGQSPDLQGLTPALADVVAELMGLQGDPPVPADDSSSLGTTVTTLTATESGPRLMVVALVSAVLLGSVGLVWQVIRSVSGSRDETPAATAAVGIDGTAATVSIVNGAPVLLAATGAMSGDHVSFHFDARDCDGDSTVTLRSANGPALWARLVGQLESTIDAVMPSNAAGPFEFVIEPDRAATGTVSVVASRAIEADPVTVDGDPVDVTFTRPGQTAVMPVAGVVAGDRVSFHATETPEWSSDGSAVVILRSGTGSNLGEAASNTTMDLVIPAAAGGPFTLEINPDHAATGTMSIVASRAIKADPVTLGGDLVDVTFTRPGQTAVMPVAGVAAGDRVSFHVIETPGWESNGSARAILRSGTGSNLGLMTSNTTLDLVIPPEAVGPFTLEINPDYSATGALSVLVSEAIEADPVTVGGGPVQVVFARPGQTAMMPVAGVAAGDRVSFYVIETSGWVSNGSASVILRSGTGSNLGLFASNTKTDLVIPAQAVQPFKLEINPDYSATGALSVSASVETVPLGGPSPARPG